MAAARDRGARGMGSWVLWVMAGLAASPADPAVAQLCSGGPVCQFLSCRSPAFAPPTALWGELKPATAGQVPSNRDSTDFAEFFDPPGLQFPHWMSLDIENGWVFAAVDHGLEIWDARFNPGSPTRVAQIGQPSFPTWPTEPHEGVPIRDIDAPDGVDTVAVVGFAGAGGLVVFDTTSKAGPTARYADRARTTLEVYAARIAGRNYAFGANTLSGLLAYDLTAAQALSGLCTDDTPAENDCGVYRGQLGTRTRFRYVDGVGDASGNRHWVVASGGSIFEGLEIWEVSNPSLPVLKIEALPNEYVHGVALWRDGSRYYLALRSLPAMAGFFPTTARIYDLSCLASGGCTGLAAPLWSRLLPTRGDDYFVVDSESHGRTFLYFGAFDQCSLGAELENEWLFDVSCPRTPRDVMPPPATIDGTLTSYWGWYYRVNPTGFNAFAGRVGKFHGSYFYRAANSIFDVHQRAVDPNAIFEDGFECGTLPWTEVAP